MAKNILIIPDVHGRTFWREPVSHIDDYERVIFLGDYLDPYPYEEITFDDSLIEFRDILKLKRENPEKVVLLLGNHDIHYLWPEYTDDCRRDEQYLDVVRMIFRKNIEQFELVHEEYINDKHLLFSHAGIIKGWLEENIQHIPAVYHSLTKEDYGHINYDKVTISQFCRWINDHLTHDVPGIIANIGRERGGINFCGSLVWADLSEHYKSSFESVFQIFGHTQSLEPTITDNFACLDCLRAFVLSCEGDNINFQ